MAIRNQAPLPFYEHGLPQLDRFQRIEVLDRDPLGFLPVTKPEQVEAMGLQDVISKTSGVSRHLAEVAMRRKNLGLPDPESAPRKITRNYVEWALDAQRTGRELDVLAEELAEINPGLSFAEPDLGNDIGRIGLLKFLRFYDLALLRETGKVEAVGYDPQKVSYAEENGGILAHLEMAQTSWRVGQVKRALPLAQRDAANRFLFWTPRLVEVARHSMGKVKAIAQEGLDKIYDRQKV